MNVDIPMMNVGRQDVNASAIKGDSEMYEFLFLLMLGLAAIGVYIGERA